MTWISIVIATLSLAVLLFFVRASKGRAHDLESLHGPIRGLLRQGYNGGFLVIDVARSKKFLQFSKYIHGPGQYGIELGFPNASWSKAYFRSVRQLCDNEQLSYRVSAGGDNEDPLDFLYVDFGMDDAKATAFARKVLLEVLDVPQSARLYCALENATPFDQLIDAP